MKRLIAILMTICTLFTACYLCSCNKSITPSIFFTKDELAAINSYEYTAKGTVIAYGGGFDQNDDARDLITGKAIEASGLSSPKVLFIASGGHDEIGESEPIIESFERQGCTVKTLQPSKTTHEEIVEKIGEADIVYETGGDLHYLTDVWRETGVNEEIQKAFERGAVLIGVSTGAMCWAEEGYDCSGDEIVFGLVPDFPYLGKDRKFEYFKASGILPFCLSPHYDNISYKRFFFQGITHDGPSIALDNGTALIFHNGKYSTFIDPSTPNRKAYLFYPEKNIYRLDVTGDASVMDAVDAYRRVNGYNPSNN